MPFVAGLILILQICFAIHAIKTGKDRIWLSMIAFLPGLGCAVYFFTQVLPELNQSHTANKVGNSLRKSLDPKRELRERKLELERADTIDNRRKLAAECVAADFPHEAVELLNGCFKGGMEQDPHLFLELATAQFAAEEFNDARSTLESLIETNPNFKSHDGHLLYARSLEKTNAINEALHEYESLATSYPGEEARVRYGLLLKQQGRPDEADKLFNESIARAKRAPGYYKKKEKHWLSIAHNEKNT